MEIPQTIIIFIKMKWILIIRNQIHIISDYHVASQQRNSINSLFNRLSARDDDLKTFPSNISLSN